MTKQEASTIPRHISPKSRRWIKDVLEGWDPAPEDISVAILGAEALDEIAAAQKVLARGGKTYRDRFGAPRARPECSQLRDSRIAFLRCVRQLKESVAAATEPEPEPEAKRPYRNLRTTPEWVTRMRREQSAQAPDVD